jgi:NitT/TauT family transport system permease protein
MNTKLLRIWNKLWPFLTAIATLLLLLQFAHWSQPRLFPTVPGAFIEWYEQLGEYRFWETVGASMFKLSIGYPIACFLGGLLGLIGGLYRGFAIYLRSLIRILQSIPPITWLPILMILYGFGNVPIITIVIIASFFPMALSVLNATEGITRTHLEVARVLGAHKGQLLRKVYLPETLPSFITGAQVAFGNAWRSMIAAEMVGGAMMGLGFSIQFSGQTANMAGVIVYIMVIGTIAMILDLVILETLKRKVLHWRYVMTGEDK